MTGPRTATQWVNIMSSISVPTPLFLTDSFAMPAHPHAALAGARLDPAATRDMIMSYKATDHVSAYYKEQFLALIDCHPTDFANRYNYTRGIQGHITAQGYVYNPDLDAVALMHHKKLDIWVGFGGHAEPEDTDIIATARREVIEEGGIIDLSLACNAPIDIDIHGFPAKGEQPDHLHYDIRFLFHTTSSTLNPNDESTDVQWVKRSDLPQYLPRWLSNSRVLAFFSSYQPSGA